MGEVFNYDDRVFDIIDKNKELMRMKDVINNILKSPEIKKILEKASKGGFGLDEDDKDFSKMIVDNNYEINTILDAYMQEISVRERPPLPRDLVLDSARRSIGEKELGLLEGVSRVKPGFSEETPRYATFEEQDLKSEKLGTDRARDIQTGIVTEAVKKVQKSAKEEQERAQNVEEKAKGLIPEGAQENPSTVEVGRTEQALLEEEEDRVQEGAQTLESKVEASAREDREFAMARRAAELYEQAAEATQERKAAEKAAAKADAEPAGSSSDFEPRPAAITEAYRRLGKEKPEQPRGDRTDDGKKNNGG